MNLIIGKTFISSSSVVSRAPAGTTVPSSASHKAQARAVLKALYAEIGKSQPDLLGKIPATPMQCTERVLRQICRAGLKAENKRIYEGARKAFGLLIAGGVITPF